MCALRPQIATTSRHNATGAQTAHKWSWKGREPRKACSNPINVGCPSIFHAPPGSGFETGCNGEKRIAASGVVPMIWEDARWQEQSAPYSMFETCQRRKSGATVEHVQILSASDLSVELRRAPQSMFKSHQRRISERAAEHVQILSTSCHSRTFGRACSNLVSVVWDVKYGLRLSQS